MKPSYKTNAPNGWMGDPRRGASMGRPDVVPKFIEMFWGPEPDCSWSKLYLSRVRLDDGGYDVTGCYFGAGKPLYWYASPDMKIDGVLRALNREHAKKEVQQLYGPRVGFFR